MRFLTALPFMIAFTILGIYVLHPIFFEGFLLAKTKLGDEIDDICKDKFGEKGKENFAGIVFLTVIILCAAFGFNVAIGSVVLGLVILIALFEAGLLILYCFFWPFPALFYVAEKIYVPSVGLSVFAGWALGHYLVYFLILDVFAKRQKDDSIMQQLEQVRKQKANLEKEKAIVKKEISNFEKKNSELVEEISNSSELPTEMLIETEYKGIFGEAAKKYRYEKQRQTYEKQNQALGNYKLKVDKLTNINKSLSNLAKSELELKKAEQELDNE